MKDYRGGKESKKHEAKESPKMEKSEKMKAMKGSSIDKCYGFKKK